MEVGTLLLGYDKANIIAYKVVSYFYYLSSKFEAYVALFGTK